MSTSFIPVAAHSSRQRSLQTERKGEANNAAAAFAAALWRLQDGHDLSLNWLAGDFDVFLAHVNVGTGRELTG